VKSATNRTFNNTVLLGAEMALALAAVLGTSVPMARMLGPTKLSYYLYIQWIAMASGNIALLGIPLTTRRYMAEVLGQGDLQMARGVFRATLRLQLLISLALLIVGETLVFTLSERAYWNSSWLIVLSLAPRMIMTIPSQAHAAAGRLHYNLIAYGLASVLLVSITNIGLRSGRSIAQYGRPDRSTATRTRESSIGTTACAMRTMPRLSPSACKRATPSASPVSSTV